MIKKFIVVGALGAAAFGVVAASASALPVHTSNNNEGHGRVQQSDQITATCQTGPLEFNYQSAPADSTTSKLFAYNISPACFGSKIAAVAYGTGGVVLGTSNVVTLDPNGGADANSADADHIYPTVTFPSPLNLQDIQNTVLTISDGLHN